MHPVCVRVWWCQALSNRQSNIFQGPFIPSELPHREEFHQFFWHLVENKNSWSEFYRRYVFIPSMPFRIQLLLCDSFICLQKATGLVETFHFWFILVFFFFFFKTLNVNIKVEKMRMCLDCSYLEVNAGIFGLTVLQLIIPD